jgi:hypothetical protein
MSEITFKNIDLSLFEQYHRASRSPMHNFVRKALFAASAVCALAPPLLLGRERVGALGAVVIHGAQKVIEATAVAAVNNRDAALGMLCMGGLLCVALASAAAVRSVRNNTKPPVIISKNAKPIIASKGLTRNRVAYFENLSKKA